MRWDISWKIPPACMGMKKAPREKRWGRGVEVVGRWILFHSWFSTRQEFVSKCGSKLTTLVLLPRPYYSFWVRSIRANVWRLCPLFVFWIDGCEVEGRGGEALCPCLVDTEEERHHKGRGRGQRLFSRQRQLILEQDWRGHAATVGLTFRRGSGPRKKIRKK